MLSGGTTEYEAIKRAWDLVGISHVLKELNCGADALNEVRL